MKMLRAMFVPAVQSVVVAVAGVLAWGTGAPASAAQTASSVQATVSGQTGAPSGAQTLALSESGTTSPVTGASTESVKFSGRAQITARVAEDPDFRTPPIVLLTIDLNGVNGVGAATKQKYVTTNRTVVQRRLVSASDTVRISFPYWRNGVAETGKGPAGTMTISLTYDLTARTLTAAAASVTGQ
ncbi:MAG TPA: hypothetical protein VKD72_25600 [Gemmataceae bacterium]|nr:hypothetical protein [Gemmataceae bacterium]